MSWRQRFRHSLAVVSLVLSSTGAQAGLYSNLYVFGDSLSDTGNDLVVTGGAVPSPAYYTDGTNSGRFTNGLNYVDHLAAGLGLSAAPSVLGGTNYAYGGARTDSVAIGLPPTAQPFNQQVGNYIAGGVADPSALYVLWIGANDMSDVITAAAAADPATIPALVNTKVNTVMSSIVGALTGLAGLGAQHFLVPNLPNLSLTPGIRFAGSSDLSALAGGVSALFNANLSGLLSASAFTALDINTLDVFSAQTDITNDPASYGFTDVSSACYTGEPDGSARPGWGTPTVCADPTGYMYFDYQHPSAQLHARLAQLAFSAVVPEPDSLALLFTSLGLMGVMARRRR